MNHCDVIQSFLEFCQTSLSSIESAAADHREAVDGLGFRHFACLSPVDSRAPASCVTPPRGSPRRLCQCPLGFGENVYG